MSLTNPSLFHVVKKQYRYKLMAYIQVFTNLIALQLLAIFFSLNGVGSMGSSSASIELYVRFYSADLVVSFTILWGFIAAILITSKAYRNDDFAFVTNRISSNLSNALFLLTASFIGGITAMFSSYLLKVIMFFFVSQEYVISTSGMAAPLELLLGCVTTAFYVFLACALGYLVGTLVQISRIFIVLIPALFFGALIGVGNGKAMFVKTMFTWIFFESSISIFIFKVIAIAALLFSSALILSNRMEVRQ